MGETKGVIAMPSLVVIFGRDRGRHFPLGRGDEFTLGRSRLLANHLNDPSISREHLQFVHQAVTGECCVFDLGARNGSKINNRRLFRTQSLNDGDLIQMGYTLLVFVQITFDAGTSVHDFLEDCEKTYARDLERLRDHGAIHVERDDPGYRSAGSMSGTLHLGHLFQKKPRGVK